MKDEIIKPFKIQQTLVLMIYDYIKKLKKMEEQLSYLT